VGNAEEVGVTSRLLILTTVLGLLGCARKSEPITGADLTSTATSTATTTSTATATSTSTTTPTATSTSYSLEATYAAQDAGMKRSIFVPYPTPCPTVAPTPNPALAARGKLAPFIVDFDAFMRGDVGVEQAVALLGKPVLCSREGDSRFMNMELAPISNAVNGVTLETEDGELIGLILELENAAPTNLADVPSRYAPMGVAPSTAHRPGSDRFQAQSAAYDATLSLSHDDFSDPPSRRMVKSIIMRRAAKYRLLADALRAENDVVRMSALALWKTAPELVDFAGYLGVYSKPVADKATFSPLPDMRNVAASSFDVRKNGSREPVVALHVTLAKPIALDARSFGRALAASLSLPLPASPVVVGDRTKVSLVDASGAPRGTVSLALDKGMLTSIDVERAP
jgi:hypothetical protein